jgi:hypothetical protein
MSKFLRWFIAIALMAIGIAAALFSLAFLGFFSWGYSGAKEEALGSILRENPF